jgi:endonuclease YncB( thermonuclease family)
MSMTRTAPCTVTRARRLVLVVAAVVALAGPFLLPTAAMADVNVQGRVTAVPDGDTFDVDVFGDGTSRPIRVRSIGVNTMELHVYSTDLNKIQGDCHAVEATRRLASWIKGKVVRITSRYASSKSGVRYRRSVEVKTDGVWRDVHWYMMREGHALFLGLGVEYRKNRSYMRQAQYAKRAGKNLWDPDYCGAGPAANLTVSVKYDAVGKDASNLNGEYLRVVNHGSSDVSLAGWHVRDGGPFNYNFPSWASVGAGKTIYVHVGSGTNNASHFYWGRTRPVFDNPTGSPTYMGDGGYLFDPKGNLRASHMWPVR